MQIPDMPTQRLRVLPPGRNRQKPPRRNRWTTIMLITICVLLVMISIVAIPFFNSHQGIYASLLGDAALTTAATQTPRPSPTPTPRPFDPSLGAPLPTHRIVAFYAVPNAEPTGPAYVLNTQMLNDLQAQGKAYEQLDPKHPVLLGIDLVVSVPDNFPGDQGTYSHHVDDSTIQSYLTFCKQNQLLLFLDLNIGQARVQDEVNFFLPYLEQNTFVEMAIDPEWMFPRHDGIPGINLSNVRASDLNPVIQTLAEIPMKYHVPRKTLIIHQYRPDGDGTSAPFDPGQAEIADKRNLLNDSRVDVVIHVDSVGGFAGDHEAKVSQYEQWVKNDMDKYKNFKYGGFKLFYRLEASTVLMTPQEVLALDPPPMVITYGN
jgi:hypothetical protein